MDDPQHERENFFFQEGGQPYDPVYSWFQLDDQEWTGLVLYKGNPDLFRPEFQKKKEEVRKPPLDQQGVSHQRIRASELIPALS
jgi:hypothetical protein